MHAVHDAVSVPPLPDLTVLWESASDLGTDDALWSRLAAAEIELSAYRRACTSAWTTPPAS